ncbi:MAG: hypothetical protein NVSMB1_20750 [Polyangiales bacterium]
MKLNSGPSCKTQRVAQWCGLFALASAITLLSTPAKAFCGFYVAAGDQPLYSDATMVALMRDGTRTVMSMSNNYRGPASDFAMVVPVPVVLQKENVKTLEKGLFSKLETLSAPRLVEYWEQDPCVSKFEEASGKFGGGSVRAAAAPAGNSDTKSYGVTVEAKFAVGEYQIVSLSAKESAGLERYLIDNKYNIPKGAASALAPYIAEQQKFFVAKVDMSKVSLDSSVDGKGVAVLSPLRVSFESPDFRLPVRLGLLKAPKPATMDGAVAAPAAKQDLIVYVLAKGQRYEVSNYANVFIPTNLDVTNETRTSFAGFYATLFDATIARAGGRAVVTEYSWMSSGCDPCPTPPLQDADIATLGGDVLFGMGVPGEALPTPFIRGPSAPGVRGVTPSAGTTGGSVPVGMGSSGKGRMPYFGGSQPMVLTRLHTRYDASTLSEDLVFRAADPVVGGREFLHAGSGTSGAKGSSPQLEQGARKDATNNFQARYAIRHPWAGPVTCDNPRRGVWGGPPSGTMGSTQPTAATHLATTPRGGVKLARLIEKGLDDVAAWDRAISSTMIDEAKPAMAMRKTVAEPEGTRPRSCGYDLRSSNEAPPIGYAAS